LIKDGIIIKGIGGFYYVEAAGEIFECKARGVFRKEHITPLVGDSVSISVESGSENSIEEIHPRRNSFNRPPISNIDKLIIVSSTCDPKPNTLIIDRLTAIAVHKNVEPVVVFTKEDLLEADKLLKIYSKSGIKTYAVSCVTCDGIDELRNEFKNSVNVFTGNSGVGKSSLLNCLNPDFGLETGEISRKLGRGRHTTRHVELYHFLNGYIADTPGFSSLDFETNDVIMRDELAYCFPDFKEYIGSCKFTSCSHVNDKGCKIVEAVKNGKISESRHESYIALFNEVKDIKEWQL
jgi:ribosome biogenesis GTPase